MTCISFNFKDRSLSCDSAVNSASATKFCESHYKITRQYYQRYKKLSELSFSQNLSGAYCQTNLQQFGELELRGAASKVLTIYNLVKRAVCSREWFSERFVFPAFRDSQHDEFVDRLNSRTEECKSLLTSIYDAQFALKETAPACSIKTDQDDKIQRKSPHSGGTLRTKTSRQKNASAAADLNMKLVEQDAKQHHQQHIALIVDVVCRIVAAFHSYAERSLCVVNGCTVHDLKARFPDLFIPNNIIQLVYVQTYSILASFIKKYNPSLGNMVQNLYLDLVTVEVMLYVSQQFTDGSEDDLKNSFYLSAMQRFTTYQLEMLGDIVASEAFRMHLFGQLTIQSGIEVNSLDISQSPADDLETSAPRTLQSRSVRVSLNRVLPSTKDETYVNITLINAQDHLYRGAVNLGITSGIETKNMISNIIFTVAPDDDYMRTEAMPWLKDCLQLEGSFVEW
jgi:hypothetical protein